VVQPSRESVYRVSKKTLAAAASVVATLATIFFSLSVRSRRSHSANGRRITAERGCCRYCLRARAAEITDSLVYKPRGEGLLTTRPGVYIPGLIRVRSLFLLPIDTHCPRFRRLDDPKQDESSRRCRNMSAGSLWAMPEDVSAASAERHEFAPASRHPNDPLCRLGVNGGCRRHLHGTAGLPSAAEMPCAPGQLRLVPIPDLLEGNYGG
jgi:hypothetical protein